MSTALSKVADSSPGLFVEMIWRTGRRPRGEVFGRARARLAQLTSFAGPTRNVREIWRARAASMFYWEGWEGQFAMGLRWRWEMDSTIPIDAR